MGRIVRVDMPGDTKRFIFYGTTRRYDGDEVELEDKDADQGQYEKLSVYMVPVNFEAEDYDKHGRKVAKVEKPKKKPAFSVPKDD